jgi:phage-related protein
MAGKRLQFHGNANECLRKFPADVSDDLGYQLYRVQLGLEPADWKPMPVVGKGVREIRFRNDTGAYRAIYLAALPDAVHVYHVFQKKTQKTAQRDLEIAKKRYREHMRSLK